MNGIAHPKDFLSFWDLPDGGIEALILRAEELRQLRAARTPHPTRPGRVLGMVFEKASTRTRASFEIAMYELGGHALYLGMQGSQLERGEPIRDTARVLSGYCHGIMVRTFGHDRAEEIAPLRERAGHQRPHRSASPLPGARRPADGGGPLRRLGRRPARHAAPGEVRLDRRRQQHGELLDRGGRDPGPRPGDRLPGGLRARRQHDGARARHRAGPDHASCATRPRRSPGGR